MINTVYYLFIALAPCCLGIYFNWRTAKKLRKACVFVNTEGRQCKFFRIMKLSWLFTYMLVFYFLIDFIHQFNILYHMTDLMNFDEWDWERYMNQYIQATHSCFSTKSLIQSFTFAAYSVQSFFIPSVLFWFTNKQWKLHSNYSGTSLQGTRQEGKSAYKGKYFKSLKAFSYLFLYWL